VLTGGIVTGRVSVGGDGLACRVAVGEDWLAARVAVGEDSCANASDGDIANNHTIAFSFIVTPLPVAGQYVIDRLAQR
jgi:hypothetical protein